jgi:hypothetical protein
MRSGVEAALPLIKDFTSRNRPKIERLTLKEFANFATMMSNLHARKCVDGPRRMSTSSGVKASQPRGRFVQLQCARRGEKSAQLVPLRNGQSKKCGCSYSEVFSLKNGLETTSGALHTCPPLTKADVASSTRFRSALTGTSTEEMVVNACAPVWAILKDSRQLSRLVRRLLHTLFVSPPTKAQVVKYVRKVQERAESMFSVPAPVSSAVSVQKFLAFIQTLPFHRYTLHSVQVGEEKIDMLRRGAFILDSIMPSAEGFAVFHVDATHGVLQGTRAKDVRMRQNSRYSRGTENYKVAVLYGLDNQLIMYG